MDNQAAPKKQSPRKLTTAVDAIGTPLEIWYSDTLGGSPAMVLFLKTYVELIERGWATPHLWNDANNFNVVYCADSNGKVLGGITFEFRPMLKQGWIILSFTDPDTRGRRINQIIHTEFEALVKARGGTSISSNVHINNRSRLQSANRVGLVPEYYKTYKSLI